MKTAPEPLKVDGAIIYQVRDPRNDEVFYVGKTIDLVARAIQHLRNPVSRDMWLEMRDILMSGHCPEFDIVDIVPYAGSYQQEIYWICQKSIQYPLYNRDAFMDKWGPKGENYQKRTYQPPPTDEPPLDPPPDHTWLTETMWIALNRQAWAYMDNVPELAQFHSRNAAQHFYTYKTRLALERYYKRKEEEEFQKWLNC